MTKLFPEQKTKKNFYNLRVRVIKAPLVDGRALNEALAQRQRAVVL